MLNKAEPDIRIILPFIAVIVIALVGGMFITQVSIGIAFAIVGAIIIALICFMNPELGLYILICAMLLGPQFGTGGAAGEGVRGRGLTLRLDDFLLLIIGFSWFLSTAVNKERGLFLKTPLNRYIAAYFIACLVATIIGYMMGRVKGTAGFFFVLKYFEYYIVYFMAVNYLKEKKQMERLVWTMLIVCLVVCAISIYQIPSGVRVSAPFEGETGEPNTLGGYLVLILSLVSGLLFNNYGTKSQKFFFGGLVLFILITLAATHSRSSWLALGPMMLALIWFSKRKFVVIIPLIFLVILSAFLVPSGVKERALFTFAQPKEQGQLVIGGVRIDTSTSARLESWKNVLAKDFIEQPILGYGVTGYSFMDAQYPRVLAETGLLGLFFFIALLVAIYRNALNAWRRYADDPFYLGVSTGFLAGFFAMLTHAIGANTFIIVRIMEPFWFLTAIVIMIPRIGSSLRPDASETDHRLLKPI
ncbi:MAG: O-antigen ligase family protein [Desulfobacterales bacterium]|nr:O-antigen ligase family protein [Desulfobacterales bacterium]